MFQSATSLMQYLQSKQRDTVDTKKGNSAKRNMEKAVAGQQKKARKSKAKFPQLGTAPDESLPSAVLGKWTPQRLLTLIGISEADLKGWNEAKVRDASQWKGMKPETDSHCQRPCNLFGSAAPHQIGQCPCAGTRYGVCECNQPNHLTVTGPNSKVVANFTRPLFGCVNFSRKKEAGRWCNSFSWAEDVIAAKLAACENTDAIKLVANDYALALCLLIQYDATFRQAAADAQRAEHFHDTMN